MKLKKLNDFYIDLNKISYIGPIDSTIKYGVDVNIKSFYFILIVEGHSIQITEKNLDNLKKIQEKIIDEINHIPGILPG